MNEKAIEAADASIGREANALPSRLRMWAHPQNWPGTHSVESDVVRYDMRAAADELDRLSALPPLRAREEDIDAIAARLMNEFDMRAGFGASKCRNAAREIVDSLSRTAGQEWRAPEGWQLVPKEPTAEMLAASWAATTKRQPEEYMAMALLPQHEQHGVKMGNRYRAMLAAAPVPAPPVAAP